MLLGLSFVFLSVSRDCLSPGDDNGFCHRDIAVTRQRFSSKLYRLVLREGTAPPTSACKADVLLVN